MLKKKVDVFIGGEGAGERIRRSPGAARDFPRQIGIPSPVSVGMTPIPT